MEIENVIDTTRAIAPTALATPWQIQEGLRFGLQLHGMPRQEANEALRRVGAREGVLLTS